MRGNRGVEILDAQPTPVERGLDAAIRVTDRIGPFNSLHF